VLDRCEPFDRRGTLGPAKTFACAPGALQAGQDAFPDALALKLRNRAEDVQHQPARRAGRVDALAEGHKPHTDRMQLVEQEN